MAIKHFSLLVRSQAEKYGDREVFRHKDFENDKWISTSWTQFSEQVELIALAFLTMGVREQENIATYTQNRPEGLIIDFAAYEKKKPFKQAEKSQEEHKEQEELWQMENWNREDLDGVEKKKKDSKPNNREVKKENRDRLWKTAGFLLALLILLGITAGMAAGYLPRVSTGVFLSVILGLMVLGMLSYILMKKIPEKKQNPHEETDRIRDFQEKNIYEIPQEKETQPEIKEHEVSEENTECFGETVVLSAGITKGPATLVSHEPGELATIYLDRDITVIGKLETAADAVINMPTVSRIHAKIRKRDGEYYLTDLNSRNGTSVNGQILKNGEDRLLEDEDEVDFAQARYIFLK